ncbi:MAG: radical SAM protein [Oscillospiraceae bacterium]|nr:radical SAM protein [Oscillospiraceae bacterium]
MNALIDTLSVLLNADLPESEKIDALRDMFLCEHARTLAAREDFGALFGDAPGQTRRRGELFSAAANWLLTREEVADEQIEGYCELGEFLCAACENADGWIFFKKLLAQFLVENNRTDEAKPRLDELRELLPDDDEIKAMIGDTGATLAGPSGTDGPCGDAGVAARLRDEKNFVAGAERQDFIIVGANSWGGVLYQKLVAERGSAAGVSLCDLTGKFAGKIVNVGSAGSVRVMPFEKLRALPVRERRRTAVVLAEQQLYWKSALAALKESGIGDVYVLPTHAYTDASVRATDLLYKVPAERPILTYYEYHVTDHCNLKCKHCGHFSNLVAAPVYCDLEQYKKDVKRLGELFWNVARLRLMGGEPLLNPELPEFIRVTRETFPVADLHVVTNGLLIPTADGTVFEAMREHRVTFHISGYAPTHKMRGKIEARCAAEGVVFGIDPLIKEFTTTQLPLLEMPPSDDWEAAKRVHKQCGFNAMCHFLRDGYLYYCGGALLPILYDRFGLDITENHLYMNIDKMRFDLSDMTLDGWEMNEILDNAHEECRYCVNTKPRAATIPWETCPSENARLEDYL